MNCDFIKNLTPEQKTELRKLLEEESIPKYGVKVYFWDEEKPILNQGQNILGIKGMVFVKSGMK